MATYDFAVTNLDTVTGLPSLQDWGAQVHGGRIPESGSLIAVNLSGLGGVAQKYGRDAGETLLREITQRLNAALPRSGVLLRGADNMLVIWFPTALPPVMLAFTAHLRAVLCADPVLLPQGEAISPNIILAAIQVTPELSIAEAQHALERELVRQPEFSAPPVGVMRVISSREELEHRLSALGLFGCDRLVEKILGHLRLPALLPRTAIVSSQALGGKTRLLKSIARLLNGQRLSIAEVLCPPEDQLVPCSLLAALLYQFCTNYPAESLRQQFATLYREQPWLGGILPMLASAEAPAPPPPADVGVLGRTLGAVLAELARTLPLVGIIHHAQLADADSLAVLAGQQRQTGHGVRLILGVDQEDERLPISMRDFQTQAAIEIRLPPFTPPDLRVYLRELFTEEPPDDITEALFDASAGRLLSVEMTLRDWADLGVVQFREGRWVFAPERLVAEITAPLGDDDRRRLCRAALACPLPLSLLTALWQTSPEDAGQTVERARTLGYLSPLDFDDPDLVQFVDQDVANTLTAQLSAEERTALHAEIAELLEAAHPRDIAEYSRPLAYHLTQAGMAEQAQRYLAQLRLAAPARIPILVSPRQAAIGGAEDWTIPPANAIDAEDLERVISAALALRLAGVQFHLYPATSDLARAAAREAMTMLQELLRYRPSFIVTFDGRTVAFDGQFILRRDLQVAVRDFATWMGEGNIRAIGIARGVREYELSRFLQAMVSFSMKDGKSTLLDKVLLLNLSNIQLLTRSFQPDLPQMNLPPISVSGDIMAFGAETEITEAVRFGATEAPERQTETIEGVPSLANPEELDAPGWLDLPEQVAQAPARVRRALMANLAHWLGEVRVTSPIINDQIDALLQLRLQNETEWHALHETTVALEHRLQTLIEERAWPKILHMVEMLYARLQRDTDQESREQLIAVMERVGENSMRLGMITHLIGQPEAMAQARTLVSILGDHALRPLIDELKRNTVMQERKRLLRVLIELGDVSQPLLLDELHTLNPWYVYRNILQVLAEVGNEEAISGIGERMTHEDYRVRVEAITAAVKIARGRGTSYLAQGLEDAAAPVRARAASLIALCPQPRILEIVLRLLQTRSSGRDGLDAVQLTACMGLGAFTEESARDALVQILHPRMFSPYRGKSEEIRCATINALVQHLPHPEAEKALQQATSDKSSRVSQLARRAWQQYERGQQGG